MTVSSNLPDSARAAVPMHAQFPPGITALGASTNLLAGGLVCSDKEATKNEDAILRAIDCGLDPDEVRSELEDLLRARGIEPSTEASSRQLYSGLIAECLGCVPPVVLPFREEDCRSILDGIIAAHPRLFRDGLLLRPHANAADDWHNRRWAMRSPTFLAGFKLALEYLAEAERTVRVNPRHTSAGMCARAELFHRERRPHANAHIPQGAFLAAAYALDFHVVRTLLGRSARINIAERSLQRFGHTDRPLRRSGAAA